MGSSEKISAVIWGAGFVGATAYRAFEGNMFFDLKAWDINPESSKLYKDDMYANFVSKEEALAATVHFICVPTPMKKDTGECDISIVESVVKEISENKGSFHHEIVIKSTVPVGTCEMLSQKYDVKIIFNPEFLTEANAYEDFISLPYQIFGFTKKYNSTLTILSDFYDHSPAFKNKKLNLIYLRSEEAEMVKLMRNCYLATRLSFFNEMKQFADALGINFENVTASAGLDKRIGAHYNKVPGPDGKLGFSLSCLPKDLNDVIFAMKKSGVKPTVLKAVWEKNLEVRPEKDWEQMKKAVVE
jgi:UDPglucose 6-dehydrogenase